MSKNRLWLTLLILVAVIGLVACSDSSDSTSSGETTSESTGNAQSSSDATDEIVVGFAQLEVSNDLFQSKLSKDLQKLVDGSDNVKGFFLDAMYDPVEQNIQIEDLIQRKVEVIAVIPVNGESVVPAVKKAYEAGIKVISYNTNVAESGHKYVTSTVGQDNVKMGNIAGEVMIEALRGKGKVVEITGAPGFPITTEFSGGFHDVVNNNSDIEILESQPGDWQRDKSRQVMENFITKYGDEIKGVYVGSDPQAFGAIDAIKAAGLEGKIKVVTASVFPDGFELLASGDLSYYGGTLSSPPNMAKLVYEATLKIAAGEEVPYEQFVDLVKLTPETVKEHEKPDWNN